MNGGFNPLKGFNTEADYNNVVENMRLADGTLWPIPITLDVSEKFADAVAKGGKIALRDAEGVILAGDDRHRQMDPQQEAGGRKGVRLWCR